MCSGEKKLDTVNSAQIRTLLTCRQPQQFKVAACSAPCFLDPVWPLLCSCHVLVGKFCHPFPLHQSVVFAGNTCLQRPPPPLPPALSLWMHSLQCLCVCVCVCVHARARVCVCVYVERERERFSWVTLFKQYRIVGIAYSARTAFFSFFCFSPPVNLRHLIRMWYGSQSYTHTT